ncbi:MULTISPECIES: LacI family DNA-binding transcriptional regulator [unclassified Polaribacter]|jgi:LacI family transcriptional regulator|uniref:LacI family DNA-binding transcriptional regulator n=1 Tax=unclassified Polaribacter TaxID=196858 RepID=UPI00052D0D7C|nr:MULTISPECIES: LacI family DNA-binding transcriptional regulator [unclassified Polaribacter]KGL59506.1 transcriptional regulator, LacI family [Polaribacter sp. Hel1_33_49]MDG1195806.1 LacI family DNA-binding transcriptional regulator [Polaribacter sp.]MDG1402721.1 LacI family DNA-binding transcriptional regulator [Polaribacter sp.]MDG2437352.1 LacI family DNA-binding transcriptional regulator [Polaribacter sp.]PKV63999.1 LacI family transcriptional regulator [Polaribacter sp. Hel1_33_96]
MKQKITIKTIAKELGVSTSTVSKALKDSHEISTETKKKIQAYANYYNYKPNSLALQLRTQKTKVIGVILPKIVHHFFSTVIMGIEEGANEKGYHIMVCFSNESYKKEVETLKVLSNGSVDGLIVSIASETLENKDFNHFKELVSEEIPLVLFDRVVDEIQCDKVVVDDVGAGYKATKHLIKNGRKKIALITTPNHVNVGALRRQGYEKALIEEYIKADKDFIVEVDEKKDIKPQIEKLFDKGIDAIFAVNEIYAANAMRIAKEQNLKVPKDISIIGFTDGLISEYSSPSITTVAQHGFTMGKQAVELLIDRIENESEVYKPKKIVISSDLKLRESTKPSS